MTKKARTAKRQGDRLPAAKKRLKLFCLLPVLILLPSCNTGENPPPLYETGFISMDTYISLTVYGENAEEAAGSCRAEIERLEALMSVTDPDSEVSQINRANGEKVTVSADTAKVIAGALQTGEESGGALDITLRPVLTEWGFTTGDYKVPDGRTLERLLEKTDYKAVKLDGNSVELPEGYQIDLGSAAKGYAGDKAAQVLKEKGITSALINLGGNVQTIGKKPDGTDWRVAVRSPFDESNMCVLEVSGKALVTSGNYERYFEDENGTRYHHIIDPADGCPADNGIVSATVIGDSGLYCDTLSTAVFVMGADRAAELWQEKGGFELILVTDDKKILITEGIADIFSNRSDMEVTVISSESGRQSVSEKEEAPEITCAAAPEPPKTAEAEKTAYKYTDENGLLTEKAVQSMESILQENKRGEGKDYTGLFDFNGDSVPEVYLVREDSEEELLPVDVFSLDGEYLGSFRGYCRGGSTKLVKESEKIYVYNFYERPNECRLNQTDRLVFSGGKLQAEPYFKAYATAEKNYPLLETVEYFSESEKNRTAGEEERDHTYDYGYHFYGSGENPVSICAFDFIYDVSYEEMAEKTAEVYGLYVKLRLEAEKILTEEGISSENAADIEYFFDDFDKNGEYEAFFCIDGTQDMYFINGSHYEKIESFENQYGGYWYYCRVGGLFIAQPSGNSSKCRVFGVSGDTWYEPECSFGGMLGKVYGPETGTFFLYQSRYDAASPGGRTPGSLFFFTNRGRK